MFILIFDSKNSGSSKLLMKDTFAAIHLLSQVDVFISAKQFLRGERRTMLFQGIFFVDIMYTAIALLDLIRF